MTISHFVTKGKVTIMNASKTLRPIIITLAILLLVALTVPAGADPTDGDRWPELVGDCEILEVPVESVLVFRAYAVGVQIYRWNGSWTLVAPEAALFADAAASRPIGIHYVGPTWESVSGSKVVVTLLQRCTPDPNSIPWFLLGAVYNEGPGIFQDVDFIQRLNTVGGKAPAAAGDFPGQVVRVPYTAEYYFYKAL
jgi:hypothetical protein